MQRHPRAIALVLLLGVPVAAMAQQQPAAPPAPPAAAAAETPAEDSAGVLVRGSISTGFSQIDNDTNSSKLTEYRDLDDRAIVPWLSLSAVHTGDGRYFDFTGANVSLRDQSLFARGGVAGVWRAGVDWRGIPHNYSNKAQTPYIQRGPGLFEVPAQVPITFKKLATAGPDTPGVLASDDLIATYQRTFLHLTPLETDTSDGRLSFQYSGWDALSIGGGYRRRAQSGQEPTFGPIGDRPPRTLNIQMAEPIDSLTQELTVSAERLGTDYALQVNYLYSDYANRVDTLVWENIYTTAAPDATYDTWDRIVSTYGRRPLEPDNRYHYLSATLGRDFVRDSRLNVTAAYGRLEQNEDLLPYSYSVDRLANTRLARSTAMASINTVQLLADYVITPLPRLNVRAWTHYYGVDNDTPEDQWQYVTSDTFNLNGTVNYVNKRINVPYATDRTNAGAEATYRLRPWRSSLGLRYELEAAAREHRETDTTEHRVSVTYRARPRTGVNLHGRYIYGSRDGDYDPFVTREGYWYAPSEVSGDNNDPRSTFDNHPDMRRYDVADRRRTQAEATVTITPVEQLSVSGSLRYRNDDYESGVTAIQPLAGTSFPGAAAFTPGTQLGLLEDSRTRYALDLFYLPAERVSVNAFLAVDNGAQQQRGLEFNENNKQNPDVVATAELGPWTRASSQWTADTDDDIFTIGLGTQATVIEQRLILNASYTLSAANVDIAYAGFGVTNFDGRPFPANHQFAFSSPPRVDLDWHVFDLRAEVPLFPRASFNVGYTYEKYRKDDWQEKTDLPWVESVGSEFLLRDTSRSNQWGNRLFNLGADLAPSYDAHVVYATFSYRF
jgi:MtrB/PioB family decaheme-associated outer membrane protein